jgi:2-polyprenyl-6-methoxyphenol hydroxylase-like FAD-dependent oxidoreductase
MMQFNHAAGVDVQVVIAGAGPVGLLTSILLSRQGIPNLVLEKREQINVMPRARGINVRSVEILTNLDLGAKLASESLPPLWTQRFVYTETMAGEIVGVMPGNMASGTVAELSPCDYRVAAQDRLDPMLYEKAVAAPQAEVRFCHEVTGFTDHGDSIGVTVRGDDAETTLRTRYLIAADGGSSRLRGLAAIGEAHHETYNSFVAAFFHADLSRYTGGREGALIWTLAPGVEGVFHPLDGKTAWAAHIQFNPQFENPDAWTAETVVERVRGMIGAPAGEKPEIDLHKHYRYTLTASVSERLRKGRLILAGDAAHRTLPYGGWGLNTGIHSAHNLAWKLGAVMRGEAPEMLLDTYDGERRESALVNCAFGKVNAGHIAKLMMALRQSATPAERRALIAASRQYGNWTGLDLGIHYDGTHGPCAFVSDDIAVPMVENPVIDYVPHAKPGWRAPHFWARTKAGGHRVSTIELLDGGFVVLAGPEGRAWCDAARAIDGAPKVMGYRIAADGDLVPEHVDFCALYGIGPGGAVLVRPDGHVAFRAPRAVADSKAVLASAFDQTLQREQMPNDLQERAR